MEVKGQLILAPEPLTCPSRKQNERMAELQERRRSLQVLLSVRLAELRRICLQEAELTGAVPNDFPLEAGEKPPCVRRRAAPTHQGNRKCRVEQEEEGQRPKPRKTLFSAALRKHSDSENGTHTHTHTHHGKRTVHRGCHTDDTVRSESSSTSDSAGNDNDNAGSQCRPLLVSAGSPVDVFNQNKPKKSLVLSRTEHHENTKPPPPPRSQDSSSSSDPGREAGCRASRQSNGSDSLLTHSTSPEDEGGARQGARQGAQQGAPRPNGATVSRGTNAAGSFWSSETLTERRGRNHPAARGGGYSEVLLDYVWEKQRQLQRQQSQPSRPVHGAGSAQQPGGAPPIYRSHHGDQRRVTVTRTKSCGPFLPVQQNHSDVTKQAPPTIQPDPHPHLLPPRPPQLPPQQDSQLEEATRSLHKALALEGLRDWYLRNTLGSSHQNQACGKGLSTASTKPSGGVKGQAGGVGAQQQRRTAHKVLQQSTYQNHHYVAPHHKQTLPHSATFHRHPLHGRSVDSSLYQDSCPSQKQEVPLRDLAVDQPSPGTLV
ncbi:coiled-coil domain-containing protein 120-like [Poeciliopsis prolifica]|uniref:coiled-coil domain-containing protein 120-like n=1 Tax=Poeciliopsis prolifica TaxID=188132 RepID=UPI002413DA79|nr:coiled-coil domain-containing protein 120-like [Poeciliopsis prolifica]